MTTLTYDEHLAPGGDLTPACGHPSPARRGDRGAGVVV